MDKAIQQTAPYFDSRALRAELTANFRAHGDDAAKARRAMIERLKALVADARAAARRGLRPTTAAAVAPPGLSHFQDELIRVLYDYTVAHVYRATNPSDAERMAIVATGGYGRALLAPGSDIDLLFLLPYKKTAWGESVAEYILYMLWDLGFKVGHATRTVDQCIKMSSDVTVRTALLDARLIHGDGQLYGEFEERFRTHVVARHGARLHRCQDGRARCAAPRDGREPLQGRAQRQGRQGRLARSAYPALAVEVPLRAGRRRGDGRRRHLPPGGGRDLPPLRRLPLDHPLLSALPQRPRRRRC